MRNTRRPPPTFLLLVLCAGAALPGCACFLERVALRAPNRGRALDPAADPAPPVVPGCTSRALRLTAGDPPASLAIWVFEPIPRDHSGSPRGTVFLLHGWHKDKSRMLRAARALVAAGYTAVLVDLRGQGRSSGDWLTYGIAEAEDLVQVLDGLSARGLVHGPIGAYGISYGAASAIHWAGRDPRVDAVVAVACFSSLRETVPRYVRLIPIAGWVLTRGAIQVALDEAARSAGFEACRASAREAIAGSRARFLLIHGRDDFLIPAWHSQVLREAAGDRAEVVLLDGEGHNSVFRDKDGRIAQEVVRWFDRCWAAAPAGCASAGR